MPTAKVPAPSEQVIPSAENLLKIVLLLTLLFGSFALTQAGVNALAASALPPALAALLKWTLIPGMAVVNGVFIVGFAVLQHDAVHKVLFRSAFWNELWGGVTGALALIPFYANRQFHLTHHSHAHQPGLDPENAMHHHSFWYAFTVGSIVGLNLQYAIFLRNLARITDLSVNAEALNEILRDVDSLINFSDFLAERTQFLLDAAMGMISIAHNKRLNVFTVLSVVLMPPRSMSGIDTAARTCWAFSRK